MYIYLSSDPPTPISRSIPQSVNWVYSEYNTIHVLPILPIVPIYSVSIYGEFFFWDGQQHLFQSKESNESRTIVARQEPLCTYSESTHSMYIYMYIEFS